MINEIFNDEIVKQGKINPKISCSLMSLVKNIQTHGYVSVDLADLMQITKNSQSISILYENKPFESVSNLVSGLSESFKTFPRTLQKNSSIWVNLWFCKKTDGSEVFEILKITYDIIKPLISEDIEFIRVDAFNNTMQENTIEIVAFN